MSPDHCPLPKTVKWFFGQAAKRQAHELDLSSSYFQLSFGSSQSLLVPMVSEG